MKQVLLVILALAVTSCGTTPVFHDVEPALDARSVAVHGCPASKGTPQSVSVAELASAPVNFHGALVLVSGYYHRSFEHSALYPRRVQEPDEQHREGIWLLRMSPELAGAHVQATGYFTAKTKGHLGQWPGSLCVTSAVRVPWHAP